MQMRDSVGKVLEIRLPNLLTNHQMFVIRMAFAERDAALRNLGNGSVVEEHLGPNYSETQRRQLRKVWYELTGETEF